MISLNALSTLATCQGVAHFRLYHCGPELRRTYHVLYPTMARLYKTSELLGAAKSPPIPRLSLYWTSLRESLASASRLPLLFLVNRPLIYPTTFTTTNENRTRQDAWRWSSHLGVVQAFASLVSGICRSIYLWWRLNLFLSYIGSSALLLALF